MRQRVAEIVTTLAQRKGHINNLADELSDEQVWVQELKIKLYSMRHLLITYLRKCYNRRRSTRTSELREMSLWRG